MPVRTKRLFADVSLPTTFTTQYTAPSGETVIVKEVVIVNRSTAARNVWLFVTCSAGTGHYVNAQAVAANGTVRLATWLVLQPGDSLATDCSGTNVDMWVSGTELEGVAD